MTNYTCQECGTNKLLVYEETAYFVNSGEFFCHSTKSHDSDAKIACYDCSWKGLQQDLKEGYD